MVDIRRDYMNTKAKITLCLLIMLLGTILLISKLFDKKYNNADPLENTCLNPTEISTTSTTTTETTKMSKNTVKTTHKVEVKKNTSPKRVVSASKQEYLDYAKSYGNLNDTQLACLDYLWQHESGWNPNSVNKSSGACGIPQAYPCNKIKSQQGSNDWKAQIRWGLNYINSRYKNPCSAWNHFKNKKWY